MKAAETMTHYVTGDTIKSLREKKHYTQRQMADLLGVSDKAVSKWETARGLPDVTLLEPLAGALGVSVAELLSGECVTNCNRSCNLLRGKLYVCLVCGNVIHSVGEGAFSCCGVMLPQLEAEQTDGAHAIRVERIENDWHVTMEHPMTKRHSTSFLAYVATGRSQMVKLYPEQMAETRFPMMGPGVLYACCNHYALFQTRIK